MPIPLASHRRLSALPLLLLLGGCGEETVTVRGYLLPESDVTHAYVIGQPLRAVVEADSFVLSGIEGESFEIEFTEEDDARGRMRIEALSAREVVLRGIWFEDDLAFVERLDGSVRATVNGLRLAGPAALPRSLEVEGRVLALSGGADALVLRPHDPELPDLRVVVTPGTAFEWADGEAADEFVSIGDSLRVEGATEGGYLVATALILPRLREAETEREDAEEDGDRGGEEESGSEAREEERDGARSLERPGRGRGRGRGLQRD